MATDPGDLVLDPTCGSGTTAYVAEQWGRRWITIDTSRVALALARARIMGARYPYYLLADSPEGLRKEAEVSGRAFVDRPTHGNVRHGFVYERVPHITLKSIANNAEIDVIYDEHQPKVQAALDRLNAALRGHKTPFRVTTGGREGKDVRFDAPADATFTMPSGEVVSASALVEWEVPREAPADWPEAAQEAARRLLGSAHRPAEGDRRLDRGQGGVRVPLRPPVRRSEDRPRRRAVHRREPQPAPHARRGRERRADRSAPGQGDAPPTARRSSR